MNVNLEYYKIFYYVGRLGGITAAAEELSISQPAVSQAVRQLERALGTTLFIRTPKGVRFTTEGEVLFSYVQRGYEYILSGEKKMMQMIDLESGEIRIGASDMTLQFYLLPFLEKFHELYPKIKVIVTNGPTPETLKYLQNGKIDFGVVSSPILSRYEIEIIPVKEIKDIFVGGARFEHLKGKELTLAKLEDLPIICLEGNTSTRKYMDQFLMENGVVMRPEFELATSDMIVQFALRNLGIGCVMSEFAQKYLDKDELFQLRFDREIDRRSFCIIKDKKNPVNTAASKLLEMMMV